MTQIAATPHKIPISVMVVIYTFVNQSLKILLIERADRADYWQSVTGSVERQDDDLTATAMRELLEETGFDIVNNPALKLTDWQLSQTYEIYEHWRYRYAAGVTHNVEHVFGLELPSELSPTLAPNEHVAYQWLDWRVAAKLCFSWTNTEAIRALAARHGLQDLADITPPVTPTTQQ